MDYGYIYASNLKHGIYARRLDQLLRQFVDLHLTADKGKPDSS